MTYIPRPAHPPTSPLCRDPISDLAGFLAVLGQTVSAGFAALGPFGPAVIGIGASIGASRSVSLLGGRQR
jgi:hypothetical protein